MFRRSPNSPEQLTPEIPAELGDFVEITHQKDKNNQDLYYGVNDEGKKTRRLGQNDILEAYGYADKETEMMNNPDLAPMPSQLSQYDEIISRKTRNGDSVQYGVDEDGNIDQLDGNSILAAYGYDEADVEIRRDNNEQVVTLVQELASFEHTYARETAESRNSYIGRFAKGNSRVGRIMKKLPGVKSIIEAVNSITDKKVVEARENYSKAYNSLASITAEQLREAGVSEGDLKMMATEGQIAADYRLDLKIASYRQEYAKESSKLSNWWVQNTGLKGKLKKAALIAGAGVGVGVASALIAPIALTGIAASIVTPALAGGASGMGIAGHVNRRWANSVIDKESGQTLAAKQAEEDVTAKNRITADLLQNGEFASGDRSIEVTEARTDTEMLGNRRRMRQAKAIGGLAGGISGLLTTTLADGLGSAVDTPSLSGAENSIGNAASKTYQAGRSVVNTIGDVDVDPGILDNDGVDLWPFNNEDISLPSDEKPEIGGKPSQTTVDAPDTPSESGKSPDVSDGPRKNPSASDGDTPGTGDQNDSGSLRDEIYEGIDGDAEASQAATPAKAFENIEGVNDVMIEAGHGNIKEFKELAEANGLKVSDAVAQQAYNDTRYLFNNEIWQSSGNDLMPQQGINSFNIDAARFAMERMQELAEDPDAELFEDLFKPGKPTLPITK